MKKYSRFCAFIATILVAAMVIPMTAFASFEKYTDTDHWAKDYLRRAVEEGLLDGFGDNTLRPEATINCAQALKILCCVLDPINAVEYSSLGLTGYEWYVKPVTQAKALNLTFDKGQLNAKMTRANAFRLLTDAFQLEQGAPDLTVLDAFKDSASIPAQYKGVFASLVSGGYVEGSGGKLNPNSNIKRAEFLAVLYRIIEVTSESVPATVQDGTLVTTNGSIQNTSFDAPLWLGCSVDSAVLSNVTAPAVVFRSQKTNLSLTGVSKVGRLVIAGGTGDTLNFYTGISSIDTLVLGDGAPKKISVGSGIRRLEITGDNLDVSVQAQLDELVITGTGCTVATFAPVKTLTLADASQNTSVVSYANITDLAVRGSKNTVTLNTTANTAVLAGHNCKISGYGYVSQLTLISSTGTYDVRSANVIDNIDDGLTDCTITLTAPETLPVEQELKVTASITDPTPQACTAVWTMNGKEMSRSSATPTTSGIILNFDHKFQYTEDMAKTAEIVLTLTYTSKNGEITTAVSSAIVNVENYPADYYEITPEEAIAAVSSDYSGDGTLQWALDNDYSDELKTAWINAKGHSSTTDYLVWINREYQRVNVFKGSKGNWVLDRSFLCGTGKAGSATPVGVYTVFGRSERGWITSSYRCDPVVNFNVGTGYAFHSRLFTPDRTGFVDSSIGFPISAGCVRMYDEDVRWIFDNIPTHTTVVVY